MNPSTSLCATKPLQATRPGSTRALASCLAACRHDADVAEQRSRWVPIVEEVTDPTMPAREAEALRHRHAALVEAEGASLEFTDDGIREVARIATRVNERMENIGARRLHTVMTTLLEDVLYELPDRGREAIRVDAELVTARLKAIVEDEDLRKYIL